MVDEARATMVANLPGNTGKSLEEWITTLDGCGLEKHGQIVSLLKKDYGVTHGYANLIAREFLNQGTPEPTEVDLVAAQYAGGKAALTPIYDRLIEVSQSFGDDVEIVPKKTNVSLRRSKQFGSIVAASQKRIELEIQLPGEPESDRLKVSKGMCSHKVSLMSADEIDAELIDYLRRAWERA